MTAPLSRSIPPSNQGTDILDAPCVCVTLHFHWWVVQIGCIDRLRKTVQPTETAKYIAAIFVMLNNPQWKCGRGRPIGAASRWLGVPIELFCRAQTEVVVVSLQP